MLRVAGHIIFVVVVSQPYTINVMEENVLRGNSAIMKCHIPSFVSDFVHVSTWIETENGEPSNEIYPTKEHDYGTARSFGLLNVAASSFCILSTTVPALAVLHLPLHAE